MAVIFYTNILWPAMPGGILPVPASLILFCGAVVGCGGRKMAAVGWWAVGGGVLDR